MAVPHFVIDAPGGGGKIPLLPGDYVVHMDEDGAVLRNYENKTFHYPQPKAGTALSRPGGTGENCRWSVREHTPMMHRARTAIRTATATPHGATAAVEMRTTCDDTNPARHSPLSTHHTAHHERHH